MDWFQLVGICIVQQMAITKEGKAEAKDKNM